MAISDNLIVSYSVRQTARQTDRQQTDRPDGRTDGWTDGPTNGWTDVWTDGWITDGRPAGRKDSSRRRLASSQAQKNVIILRRFSKPFIGYQLILEIIITYKIAILTCKVKVTKQPKYLSESTFNL